MGGACVFSTKMGVGDCFLSEEIHSLARKKTWTCGREFRLKWKKENSSLKVISSKFHSLFTRTSRVSCHSTIRYYTTAASTQAHWRRQKGKWVPKGGEDENALKEEEAKILLSFLKRTEENEQQQLEWNGATLEMEQSSSNLLGSLFWRFFADWLSINFH